MCLLKTFQQRKVRSNLHSIKKNPLNFQRVFYFKNFSYICNMLRYKKGDIVICVTEKMYGMTCSLKVGEKYIVDDFIEMAEKNIVGVYSDTGEYTGVFDDKHFIPLDVYREFQLRKILE